MKKKLKIGWQKYEDLLEKQISSPMINTLMESIISQMSDYQTHGKSEDYEDDIDEDELISHHMPTPMMIPMSQQLIEDISMLSNFDCWVGHTNFDITPKIKEILNQIDGIEILKICSRYRFFIGIGQMFNFADVRKNIEKEIIPKGEIHDRGKN